MNRVLKLRMDAII